MRKPNLSLPSLIVLCGFLYLFASPLPAQVRQVPTPHANRPAANLVVDLRDENNALVDEMALVTLSTESGAVIETLSTNSGRAEFRNLLPDEYEIRVSTTAYEEAREKLSSFRSDERSYLIVTLKAKTGAIQRATPPELPILAPRAQKQLANGLKDLRVGRFDDARKQFQAAARLAPNHPDVNYLLGLLAGMTGDEAGARSYWEKAVSMYPKHVLSLTALGESYLVTGNLPEAQNKLQKAVESDANAWRAHQLLALVRLRQHAYPDAVQQAELALQLGKTEANGARLVLAEALAGEGKRTQAIQTLQDMLKQNLTPVQTQAAGRLLEALQKAADSQPMAAATHSVTETTSSRGESPGAAAVVPAAEEAVSIPVSTVSPGAGFPKWIPANVDDAVPPAEPEPPCPVQRVVEGAGNRVEEFVHAVDRFTATETLDHESLNEWGLATSFEKRKFNYLVSIQEIKPGILDVEEYRNGSTSLDVFPDHVATIGMVSLVLVFHPAFVGDYDLRCEGLSTQHGQPAWQIHFSQKPDRPGRMRSYRLGNRYYRVALKGRAWISANTYQVLRMESDLVSQVPDIRLFAEHQSIDYGPVPFQKKSVTLWLPSSTDLYLDYNGHRFHRRHGFSNYLLFSVDDRQKIQEPEKLLASETSSR
jgi:tetratricopeptide (TPR) repeat protein